MTTVINLFGGPGTGKSTTAAALFASLKQDGYNAELVTEYAKDKVWEESFKVLGNQIYIFGKQYHKMYRLMNKVDIIITDSPLLNSMYYSNHQSENFDDLILEMHHSMDNFNVFLNRVKPYQTSGRMQTEARAKEMDLEIKAMLEGIPEPFQEVEANRYAAETIRDRISFCLTTSTSKPNPIYLKS